MLGPGPQRRRRAAMLRGYMRSVGYWSVPARGAPGWPRPNLMRSHPLYLTRLRCLWRRRRLLGWPLSPSPHQCHRQRAHPTHEPAAADRRPMPDSENRHRPCSQWRTKIVSAHVEDLPEDSRTRMHLKLASATVPRYPWNYGLLRRVPVRDEARVQRLRARRRGGRGLTSAIPRFERFLHGSRDRIAARIRAADSSPMAGTNGYVAAVGVSNRNTDQYRRTHCCTQRPSPRPRRYPQPEAVGGRARIPAHYDLRVK